MKLPSTKASALVAMIGLVCCSPQRGTSAQSAEPPLSTAAAEYAASLTRIIRRGFTMPTSVPHAQYGALRVHVLAVIGEDLRFRSLSITHRSGNSDFDERVESHLAALLAANPPLPEPPAGERERFVGPALGLRFTPPRNRVNAPTGGSNDILDNLGAGYR